MEMLSYSLYNTNMKKDYSLFFMVMLLFCAVFISCKEAKLTNNIQFVEVNIPAENNDPDLNLFVSRTEITQAQFTEIMNKNPSKFVEGQLPVTNISYADAFRYCNKLNKFFGFPETYKIEEKSGNPAKSSDDNDGTSIIIEEIDNAVGFRLLTAKEAKKIFAKLINFKENDEYSFSWKLGKGWHGNRIHKVAHYIPDELGLFDFTGNAKEYLYFSQEELENQTTGTTTKDQQTLYIDTGILTYETLRNDFGEEFVEKYKAFIVSNQDATSFRICCPTTIDKSKLDILWAKDVEKDRNNWLKSNFEKLRAQVEFVPCEEYSYQTIGEKSDGSKSKINIFVSSLNVGKNEISKELYNFIMEDQLYDGIETPDFLQNYGGYYYHADRAFKEDDYINETEPKTNFDLLTAIEFCNRLSRFCGLTPCYIPLKKNTITSRHPYDYSYSYNPASNGYRLPTKSELISFEAQYNQKEEINFDPTHWNWTYDSFTEQLYTMDMYNPVNEYPSADKVIIRHAGKNRKPIQNFMNYYEVNNRRELESPNFCLRVFQTKEPEQIAEYKKKQEEAAAAKISEEFDHLVTMKKHEGGLKTFTSRGRNQNIFPDAEIADFEYSEQQFTNYLYKTLTGKIPETESHRNEKEATRPYDEIAEICNKLSALRGFEKCYYQEQNEWKCDYTKNGFRLPTVAEFSSLLVSSALKTRSLCNDYYITSELSAWETSFPHGDFNLTDEDKSHTSVSSSEWRGWINSHDWGNFHLCRTLDSEKVKELLSKNMEEKKLLAQKIDEILGMTEIPGGKYTMTYKDSESQKNVTKKEDIKPFSMMTTKFSYGLYGKLIWNNHENESKIYVENFLAALVICNKLSIQAHLKPVYKINGKTILDEGEINQINQDFTIEFTGEPDKSVKFKNIILCDQKADGYRIPKEIEWEYAGTLGEDSEKEITLLNGTIYDLKKDPATSTGLYLMNTTTAEWCFDEGKNMSYIYDKPFYTYNYPEKKGETYQTRIVRSHCGKDEIEYSERTVWSTYKYTEPKRRQSPLSSKNSFRVMKYK